MASMAQVTTGARLHFGFQNLSLAHERLYGGVGVALDEPRVHVAATPADGVRCEHPTARKYARRAIDLLDVPGAAVTVEESLPRHAGLGSGTQLALAVLAAVARTYDRSLDVRECAPDLDRGGRSGVGVATFERGGFVVDAGHPAERFTVDRPDPGEWSVPAVAARHAVPDDWRFVLALPDADPGRNGSDEDDSMRAVVERADPTIADQIGAVLLRRAIPAVVDGDRERFGAAVAEIGRLNGAWYADEQGGVYRPPVGDVIARLQESTAVSGVGQSSWGPAVYAVTDSEHVDAATDAARAAIDATGLGGEVVTARPRNRSASVNGKERA